MYRWRGINTSGGGVLWLKDVAVGNVYSNINSCSSTTVKMLIRHKSLIQPHKKRNYHSHNLNYCLDFKYCWICGILHHVVWSLHIILHFKMCPSIKNMTFNQLVFFSSSQLSATDKCLSQSPVGSAGGADSDKSAGCAVWDDFRPQAVYVPAGTSWPSSDHCW